DVIEELRPAVPDAPTPVPFGETLGDARGDAAAAVAQGHHGENAAGDFLGRSAVGRRQLRPQSPVKLLGARVMALDLDARERTVRLSGAPDVAPLHLPAVSLHGERGRDPRVGAEVHREPAVVLRRLPVARAPGAVAQ